MTTTSTSASAPAGRPVENLYPETFARAAAVCEAHGLAVTPPRGNNKWGRYMVCAEHDGVPYAINLRDFSGKLDIDNASHAVKRRRDVIARHHTLVKRVYERIAAMDLGDIWCMTGGGAQLQLFFGNKSGYVAILYLSLQHEGAFLDDVPREDGGGTTRTLQVNGAQNDQYFEDFRLPGIQLLTHKEVWGDR